MSAALTVRPEAEEDVVGARNWYKRHRPGLGGEFLVAVEDVFDRIRASPQSYPLIYRNVRWARLRRFPYLVYYRIVDETIEVLAVLHGRRHPPDLAVSRLGISPREVAPSQGFATLPERIE